MKLLAGLNPDISKVLEKGDRAPFSGVLVDSGSIKLMWRDVIAKDEFKSELQKCLEEKVKIESESEVSGSTWFLGGMVTGLVLTTVLFSVGSK